MYQLVYSAYRPVKQILSCCQVRAHSNVVNTRSVYQVCQNGRMSCTLVVSVTPGHHQQFMDTETDDRIFLHPAHCISKKNLTNTCKAVKKNHALSSLRANYKQSNMLKDSGSKVEMKRGK